MKRATYRTLTDYFKNTGHTQADLARALGVSRQTISVLTSGESRASIELAIRIREVTGVRLASLVEPELVPYLKAAA